MSTLNILNHYLPYLISVFLPLLIYFFVTIMLLFTLLIPFQNLIVYLVGYPTRLSISKLIDTDYKYIFIRDYLDKDIFKRGRVYYHALRSKLITDYKSVFNYKTKNYELRPLIKIDGIDKIDWICN